MFHPLGTEGSDVNNFPERDPQTAEGHNHSMKNTKLCGRREAPSAKQIIYPYFGLIHLLTMSPFRLPHKSGSSRR